jgi:hypothetical protein
MLQTTVGVLLGVGGRALEASPTLVVPRSAAPPGERPADALSEDAVRSDWDRLTGATQSLRERAGGPDAYRDRRRALAAAA